jgi:hypothetical protein
LKSRLQHNSPDRPQHDRPAAFVIAQQYFFRHLRFNVLSFPQGKTRCTFQTLFHFLIFLKLRNLKLREWGVSISVDDMVHSEVPKQWTM